MGLGIVYLNTKHSAQAQANIEQSLSMFREIDFKWGRGEALSFLGMLAREQGNREAAYTNAEESLSIAREWGGKYGIAWSLSNLALLELDNANLEQARRLLRESLEIYREGADQYKIATTLLYIALVERKAGNRSEVIRRLREILLLGIEKSRLPGVSEVLTVLIGLLVEQGRLNQAARLLGAVETLVEDKVNSETLLSYLCNYVWVQLMELTEPIRALAGQLNREDLQKELEAGRRLTSEETIRLSLEVATD
jgi:tetratricopeptide (TPR) repeat protein